MPLLQTRGTGSSKGLGFTASADVPTYIEDVFSAYLYSGTSAAQTITNGIDLSGKGGLIWTKSRNLTNNNNLVNTIAGVGKSLAPNNNAVQQTQADQVTAFNSNGYTLGADAVQWEVNRTGYTYASWTFRKQPKFFDVVTYTGNGSGSDQTINHNLGSTPGCIIVKATNASQDWLVWHRATSSPNDKLFLNLTDAVLSGYGNGVQSVTSASFTAAGNTTVNNPNYDININGRTYVAYLFAHNAGGFGLTGTDNVISCGSWTGGAPVVLGYEPQWVLIKKTNAAQNWFLMDNMRELNASQGEQALSPNTSGAEPTASGNLNINSTGFQAVGLGADPYIYIAIRRGPMKVPTLGTSVFSPNLSAATTGTVVTTNFPIDLHIQSYTLGPNSNFVDRLRGVSSTSTASGPFLQTASTAAQTAGTTTQMFNNTGFQITAIFSGASTAYYNFRRAPSFFDVVCYTGNGTTLTVSHNLTVAPELMIVKKRSGSADWQVYSATLGNNYALRINQSFGIDTLGTFPYWNNTSPTTTTFVVDNTGNPGILNSSGGTYVAYLFATTTGVSKVGSYTGNGTKTYTVTNSGSGAYLIDSVSNPNITLQRGVTYTFNVTASGHPFWIKTEAVTGTGSSYNDGVTNNGIDSGTVTFTVPLNAPDTLYYICQYHGSMVGTLNIISKQINCGFTSGARFVMIKRTNSTGNWYIWDTVRGIIAGNDPYLLLNSTAAEVTNTDYIDTYNAGFEISSTAPAEINANGGTYIFLAIA